MTCIGIAVLGVVVVYQARPYLRVSSLYPTAARTIKEVKTYSSGPAALLSASSENRVWGAVTAPLREHVHSKNEDVFFPGLAIFVLALLGLFASVYTRRLRIGLLVGVVTCCGARDGPRPDGGGLPLPAAATTTPPAGTACACPGGSSPWARSSSRCSRRPARSRWRRARRR